MEDNNRMGKTRDLFKNISDIMGNFHAKTDTIKCRNGMDLTEAEDIKNRNGVLFHLFHVASNTMLYTGWICEAGCQEGSRKVSWKCAL